MFNLPNRITLLRLLLIPPFMVFTYLDNVWTRILALALFIMAASTDYFDGYLARKYHSVTTLGVFMDPLVDKLLISAAFISFVQLAELNVPAWMVVLIIGREFFITGLRTLAAAKGRILPSSSAGKFKTTSQLTAIIVTLIILTINSLIEKIWGIAASDLLQFSGWHRTLGWALKILPYWLTFLTTIFTVISGLTYFNRNKDLFREE